MPVINSAYECNGQKLDIFVEVDSAPPAEDVYGAVRDMKKVIKATGDLFGEGLALVQNCAIRVLDAVRELKDEARPDEFEVQLAVKLDAAAGAFLVKFGSEAQMQITMKWIRRPGTQTL